MKKLRAAFTLIEMMIAISIFSIMTLYLYKTYSSLNIANENLSVEVSKIQKIQKIKKLLYMDFNLALFNEKNIINITNRDKGEDFVFFQTSHSVHKRFNPYITYIVKNKKLYRLESLKPIDSYDISRDAAFDVDYLGEVKSFRVYKSTSKNVSYLVAVDFKSMENILLKITPLNSY